MIKLVKNELTKIFHKKAIYIIAIITAIFTFLSTFIIGLAEDVDTLFENDQYYDMLEKQLKQYDLNDADELEWYIEDKTDIDTYKISKEYDKDSWQYYMISTNASEYIKNMNKAKYIDKNDKLYEEAANKLDEYVKEIKENDWTYFVSKEKTDTEEALNNLKKQLDDKDITEQEKSSIEKEIATISIRLEGLNYRLDKKIPYSYSNASNLVEEFVNSGISYLNYNKDEDSYISRDELLEKRNVEKTYFIAKYKLDNNLEKEKYYSASELMFQDSSATIIFIVVVIVMIAGTIMGEELSKGTIKQLLLRPYKRSKILLSKFIATLIVFALFLLYYEFVSFISYGIGMGFQSYNMPVIAYSFTSHQVIELNLLQGISLNLVSVLPEYLIILTLAFFLSVVASSNGLAVTISFLVYFFASIINGLISMTNYKVLSIFPTMCWNFNEYLFGGLPSYQYASLPVSIIVTIITFLLLFITSFIVFKHKDIKNQ